MKIRSAIYKCDFCGSETDIEVKYVFQPEDFSGSIHDTRRHFGLCMNCHRLIPCKERLGKKLIDIEKKVGLPRKVRAE